ncbi:TM0106 family RecB-like putative nuclease [Pseudonocardiaceae bacterium YIM PH 21723]|nr:TM0106 family RecB-like putative nuclease [Pseudonocardiaceae bacterium YIM PH 21723]
METPVLLDAGVVSRCRRRVHLEHDPAMADTPRAPTDPAAQQRIDDARAHRRKVADKLARLHGAGWMEIPYDVPASARERATLSALKAGAAFVWGPQLPMDNDGGRRGGIDLLVRIATGYVPVLVVRHKTTDPGNGARTSPLTEPEPGGARVDPLRKVRPQPRDQLRLCHSVRMLQAAGYAADGRNFGGVIGLDADVVLWHDLDMPSWPGGRSALAEYDSRFADRIAVATAAARGATPLALPSRIVECRSCPWWPTCEAELLGARDVSLVLRGEDAASLRSIGVTTVDGLAALDLHNEPPVPFVGVAFTDAVLLARAWLRGMTIVRRREEIDVPRGDVELDVDMESFGDAGAYMWGCYLSGVDIGEQQGYREFSTWEPLPCTDEGRSFSEFWTWLAKVRVKVKARGLTFRAYCYNELAENRWMYSSVERFPDAPGMPKHEEVRAFIQSDEWVDIFGVVRDQFLCAKGKGLKVVAPAAGFSWRDPDAGGENSMRWYRDAVGMDGNPPDEAQKTRLIEYNEDDVRATHALREWMTSERIREIPYAGEL